MKQLFGGVFAAGFLVLFPPYYTSVLAGNGILNSLLIVFHDTLRLFTAEADYGLIFDNLKELSDFERSLYTVYSAFLYAFTPLLSLGFLLSFFRGVASYWKVLIHYLSNIYVFSEINEHSVALIESIIEKDKDALIVFADNKNEDDSVVDSAIEKLGIIRIKRYICELRFPLHSKNTRTSYFFIGDNYGMNVSESVITAKNAAKGTHLYVFSNYEEHDAVLTSADRDEGNVTIHRINTMAELVNMFLYKDGAEMFKNAIPNEKGEKIIRIGIIGLGTYGREFTRNLPWFTSHKGYRTEIHVFEKNPASSSSFMALYPDLNYTDKKTETSYFIKFHECDVESLEFAELMKNSEPFTYFIVTTGDDDRNMRISFRVRSLCRRFGSSPLIRTRIYNPIISSFSADLKNHKDMPYDIRLLGSLNETYSYEAIIENEWSKNALMAQTTWAFNEADKKRLERVYNNYEYYRASSLAYTTYKKTLTELEIELSEEEEHYYEHQRWCNFMYAHGYTYAEKRDDIALTNPNLCPFYELPAPSVRG